MRKKKTIPWTLNDLKKSIKCLKRNKARDPHGIINELFSEGSMGEGLKMALLALFSNIKTNIEIPDYMNIADITSIDKKKNIKGRHVKSKRNIWYNSMEKNTGLSPLQ